MPARKGPPTRADYERLKAECECLRRDFKGVLETTRQMRQELQTQFTRIAEMQASWTRNATQSRAAWSNKLPLM